MPGAEQNPEDSSNKKVKTQPSEDPTGGWQVNSVLDAFTQMQKTQEKFLGFLTTQVESKKGDDKGKAGGDELPTAKELKNQAHWAMLKVDPSKLNLETLAEASGGKSLVELAFIVRRTMDMMPAISV